MYPRVNGRGFVACVVRHRSSLSGICKKPSLWHCVRLFDFDHLESLITTCTPRTALSENLCFRAAELFSKCDCEADDSFRLYDREIIELNKDVSVILLMANFEEFVTACEPAATLPETRPQLAFISRKFVDRE
jgi:hypothetical protein